MKNIKKIIFLIITLSFITSGNAQVSVSGLVDVVFKNSKNVDITNRTFRGFSNFHSSRARLYFDAAPAENVEVFVQVLVDNYAFQLYGAYMRFSDLGFLNMNAQLGVIPTPIGSWGPRTYSNINPLIGVPLVYNYHSSYIPGGNTIVRTVDDMIALRDNRSKSGLPVIYDACWNTGLELYGSSGKLHYSFGFLTGSVSKPTTEQSKDQPQVTTHLTYDLSHRLTIGGSAYIGPYLMEGAYNDSIPIGTDVNDFLNGGVGYELHYAGKYLEIFSEGFYSYWDHPYLNKLKLKSGYVEGKYKFTPGWFVAGRFDFYKPEKMIDSQGESQYWDYPLNRVESGLGYHPNRSTTVKFVSQINRFDINGSLDSELYAVQFSVSFE